MTMTLEAVMLEIAMRTIRPDYGDGPGPGDGDAISDANCWAQIKFVMV